MQTRHLGQSSALPASPEQAVLDYVPNPRAGSLYMVRFAAPEFTSLCPVTGQPDFAHLVIDYAPAETIVESKSLKLFLGSYRNHCGFHEDVTVGIGSADRIVVYDASPLRTAARGWFMLRHFGAAQVAILDGGFQKWVAEGRPTESGDSVPVEASFEARQRDEVVTKQQLLDGAFGSPLLDARGKGRFEGSEPDPRPGVETGHIPGARNLPYSALYDEDGTFKAPGELRRLFADAGIDPAQPFVASCGSGVTANSLIFAAHLLGNDAARLYDGSWSEWGADPATPKAIGPA
jgi:thiosulfate/3-mercaptopyruvate sulfurtransferase